MKRVRALEFGDQVELKTVRETITSTQTDVELYEVTFPVILREVTLRAQIWANNAVARGTWLISIVRDGYSVGTMDVDTSGNTLYSPEENVLLFACFASDVSTDDWGGQAHYSDEISTSIRLGVGDKIFWAAKDDSGTAGRLFQGAIRLVFQT